MYNPLQESEHIEKMAILGVNMAEDNQISLTEALRKVASDHVLDNTQVENVCARMNHIKFNREKGSNDSLTFSFKKANYEEVIDDSPVKKVASVFIPRRLETESEVMAFEKTADPVIQKKSTAFYDPSIDKYSELVEASYENADNLTSLVKKRDDNLDSIKNTVVALIQSGESIDGVYETLRKVWGKDNKEQLETYFVTLLNDLKAEGYIRDVGVDIPEEGSVPDMPIKENTVSKAAAEVLSLSDDIFQREIVHFNLMNMLKEAHEDRLVERIDNLVTHEFISPTTVQNALEKNASLNTLLREKPLLYLAGMIGSTIVSQKGMDVVNDAVVATRGKALEKKLPERFPELQKISPTEYHDIYETVINLNPLLLKAPYALANTIMKHHTTGVMDSGNIAQLIAGGKGYEPAINSQAVVSGVQSAMMAGIKDQLSSEESARLNLEDKTFRDEQRILNAADRVVGEHGMVVNKRRLDGRFEGDLVEII